ncbi:MAG TPA: hypothetical protein DIV86_01770, partial [Alphaproteobacteria bacterium]|nr:hypothetical protein [Alphaproteobacteria bacterium]
NNPFLLAIFWANISCVASGFMVNMVRHLSETMNVVEIIFFRNCFAFVMFLPYIYIRGLKILKTKRLNTHLLRSFTGVTSMTIYFYCISIMNLSVVTALSFTAPLFTAILAYFFFGEKFTKHGTLGLVVGFLGTIMIIRPGFEGYDPRYFFVVISAVFWASSSIVIKKLSRTETPLAITFYMTLLMMIMTAPVVFFIWETPTYEQMGWAFLIAFTSNILQYGIAKSLALVDFSVVLPIDFTRLIYTAILAYFAFGESPDIIAVIGSAVIIGAAFYSSYNEKKIYNKRNPT